MSSLVADYGSSSESDSAEEVNDSKRKERLPVQAIEVPKLPLPKFGENGATVTNSVFKNPFVEAENAKSAILEKHVKMIPAKEDITQINGKQICWMYRKGRCRFGHNCKFAHDTDLYNSETPSEPSEGEANAPCDTSLGGGKTDKPEAPITSEKKKKRPGLSQGLIPGKKVIQMYKKQKTGKSEKRV